MFLLVFICLAHLFQRDIGRIEFRWRQVRWTSEVSCLNAIANKPPKFRLSKTNKKICSTLIDCVSSRSLWKKKTSIIKLCDSEQFLNYSRKTKSIFVSFPVMNLLRRSVSFLLVFTEFIQSGSLVELLLIISASNLPHFCGNPQFSFSLEISVELLGFPTSGKKSSKKFFFLLKIFFLWKKKCSV